MQMVIKKPATKKRRRKKNKGWFQKGIDTRRSRYQFSRQDCRKGFRVTLSRYPQLIDWLMGKFLSNRTKRRKEMASLPF